MAEWEKRMKKERDEKKAAEEKERVAYQQVIMFPYGDILLLKEC